MSDRLLLAFEMAGLLVKIASVAVTGYICRSWRLTDGALERPGRKNLACLSPEQLGCYWCTAPLQLAEAFWFGSLVVMVIQVTTY